MLFIVPLTSKIDAREKEWQERRKKNRDDGDYSSDDEDRPPLAIEQPPPAPPADHRFYQGQTGDARPAPEVAPLAGYNTNV